MRLSSDADGQGSSSLTDLLRLQAEFQTRIVEETVGYLRRLQDTAMPVAPGTIVRPDPDATVAGSGRPGATVALSLEAENRQRVHCLVTPRIGPLVDPEGTTWAPEARADPAARLIPPGETATVALELVVPAELPPGTYRGSLLLQGFRESGVPVAVTVEPEPKK
jgi:hypothetical protein